MKSKERHLIANEAARTLDSPVIDYGLLVVSLVPHHFWIASVALRETHDMRLATTIVASAVLLRRTMFRGNRNCLRRDPSVMAEQMTRWRSELNNLRCTTHDSAELACII